MLHCSLGRLVVVLAHQIIVFINKCAIGFLSPVRTCYLTVFKRGFFFLVTVREACAFQEAIDCFKGFGTAKLNQMNRLS